MLTHMRAATADLDAATGTDPDAGLRAVATLRVLRAEAPALFDDFEIYEAPDGAEAGRVGYHKV